MEEEGTGDLTSTDCGRPRDERPLALGRDEEEKKLLSLATAEIFEALGEPVSD